MTEDEKENNWRKNHDRYLEGGDKAKDAFRGGWCWPFAHQFSSIKGIPAFWISDWAHAYCVSDEKYFDGHYPRGIEAKTFFGPNVETGETGLPWNWIEKKLPGQEFGENELRERFSRSFPMGRWKETLRLATDYIAGHTALGD